MKTPKKITMYAYDSDGNKSVHAVFNLVGGKAEGKFKGPNAASNADEFESQGVYDKKNKRVVKMSDGEAFMKALPKAFSHSSYLGAEIDD